MSSIRQNNHRIKFHGLSDLSTGFYAGLVPSILDKFDETQIKFSIEDILELYNVLQFLQKDALPRTLTREQRDSYEALIPRLHTVINSFFNTLDEANIKSRLSRVCYDYGTDLITLISKHKIHERIGASELLDTLKRTGVHLATILENKDIVSACDQELRSRLVVDVNNAQLIISQYFERNARRDIILPMSFTPDDAKKLINSYIDSDDVNVNYLKLIANSKVDTSKGVDAKTKLKAKKAYQAWSNKFFEHSTEGINYGVGVRISDTQTESITVSNEDHITILIYSRSWLDENSSPIAILNAFTETFGFVDEVGMLNLPSYTSELGLLERFMEVDGKKAYKTGIAFQIKEMAFFYQTVMFDRYLDAKNENLEKVFEWFFNEHVKRKFKTEGFKYMPSTALSYLEKSRHIFIAMDGIIKRYALLVEDGEIDPELLQLTSKPIQYRAIPSFMDGKYAYATDHQDIKTIVDHLFSDQSRIRYINESLQGKDFVELILNNIVRYEDFHDHQKNVISYLMSLDVLESTSNRVQFKSWGQIVLLRHLFNTEGLSYYHYDSRMRAIMDSMVAKGWLIRETSLLARPESSLFNYYLNQVEFSNGIDLRNKYIHDSQSDENDENTHYTTYITAVELFISLVIKINNDLLLNKLTEPKDN